MVMVGNAWGAVVISLMLTASGLGGCAFNADNSIIAVSAEPVAARDGARIEYLGNAGISIAGAGALVLIDPFTPNDYGRFEQPSEAVAASIRTADGQFSDVDFVLITHEHGDHFDAGDLVAHLAANPRALAIVPAPLIGELLAADGWTPDLAERVLTPEGEVWHRVQAGVQIEAMRTPHAGAQFAGIEHYAYVVSIGGVRILHTGDGAPDEAGMGLLVAEAINVDLALAPGWFLTGEALAPAAAEIDADEWVLFHLSTNQAASLPEDLSAYGWRAFWHDGETGITLP